MNCFSAGKNLDQEPVSLSESKRSKQIDTLNRSSLRRDAKILTLLLLGAGGSGKSTLFKQLIAIHGKGFNETERLEFKHVVWQNTVACIKELSLQSAKLPADLDTRVRPANEEHKAYIDALDSDETWELDPQIVAHISGLWADEGIRRTFSHQALFQLDDSAQYFLDKVADTFSQDYIPSEADVMRSRIRTTGIIETDFEIEGKKFRLLDVGGQRNERKKWIHCFEGVTAVVFVASMSEYDQVLFEDNKTNRIIEALNLFDEICNSMFFQDTSMILFLNKSDLFREKIKNVDLNVVFRKYTGGKDFDKGVAFLRQMFFSKNQNPNKEIYCHVTCTTDKKNVEHVFNDVKRIVVTKGLQSGGML